MTGGLGSVVVGILEASSALDFWMSSNRLHLNFDKNTLLILTLCNHTVTIIIDYYQLQSINIRYIKVDTIATFYTARFVLSITLRCLLGLT